MSFTDEVKREVLAEPLKKTCCKKAFLFGTLSVYGETVSAHAVAVGHLSGYLAHYVREIITELFHVECFSVFDNHGAERILFVSPAAVTFLNSLHDDPAPAAALEKCPHCRRAFLAGIFLVCGRISNPMREYRLEFSVGKRLPFIRSFLATFDLHGKETSRRGETLLYFRDSTSIEDFLANLGANHATFSVMDKKIERDMRNEANRVANCDANNIGKAIRASLKLIEQIKRLQEENKIGCLPPELEDTAKLRLAYADYSIAQLAAVSKPPLTKSGLNHRLAKISALAETLLDDNGGKKNG